MTASSAVLVVATACSSIPDTKPAAGAPGSQPGGTIEEQRRLAARGRSQFLHCSSCHVLHEEDPPPFGDSLGPHLENLIGRQAGSVEAFEYTDALKSLDLVWNEETLDRWLREPQAQVAGMCEPFAGIAKPEQRKALIAYLKAEAR